MNRCCGGGGGAARPKATGFVPGGGPRPTTGVGADRATTGVPQQLVKRAATWTAQIRAWRFGATVRSRYNSVSFYTQQV
jgi:hypothetical protein